MARTQRGELGRRQVRRRSRWTLAQGARAVKAWRESGLSQAAYCQQAGLNRQRLRRWAKRMGSSSAARPRSLVAGGCGALRPVRIVEAEAAPLAPQAWLELCLGGERRLRIPPGFDSQTLSRLLEFLEGRA